MDDQVTYQRAVLDNLRKGLEALRRDVLNFGNFQLMAEGWVSEIAKVETEINRLMGEGDGDVLCVGRVGVGGMKGGMMRSDIEQGIFDLLKPFIGSVYNPGTVVGIKNAIVRYINGLTQEQVNVRPIDEEDRYCRDLSVSLGVDVFEFEGELFSEPWGQIYAFDAAGQTSKAIHALRARVDSMAGRWDVLGAWLQMMDLEKLSVSLLVGVASITRSMKAHLPYRAEMMTKIKAVVEAHDPFLAERLWWNLL